MKRFLFLLLLGVVGTASLVQGRDDAAVAAAVARQEAEENFKRLQAKVDDLVEAQAVQSKRVQARLQEFAREISELREQVNKPRPVYATPEDLNRLKEAIQEVDRKRVEDAERLSNELKEVLNKLLAASAAKPAPPSVASPKVEPAEPTATPVEQKDEKGFEYVIKPNDNFVKIAKAYQARGIKVTAEQIAKANPGFKSEKLLIGKKLWIPAPAAATPGEPGK